MKRTILGTIFVLIVFVAYAQSTTNDWSKRIISKTKHPLVSFINPHVSAINILIIDGKRFERVRGLKFFYLQVPNTNSIVFVSDESNYSVTYHIFNMNTDEDIAIHSQTSTTFGNVIGSPYPYETNTVTADANGIVILCDLDKGGKSTLPSLANLDSTKELIYLDANKEAIIAHKFLYYDKEGKLIGEHDSTPPF